MHLEGKLLLRIEQLDQQRKTRRICDLAKHACAVVHPKLVQRAAAPRAGVQHALRFRAVDQLPRFADPQIRRQLLAEERLQSAPAPDSLHEERLEHKRREGVGSGMSAAE